MEPGWPFLAQLPTQITGDPIQQSIRVISQDDVNLCLTGFRPSRLFIGETLGRVVVWSEEATAVACTSSRGSWFGSQLGIHPSWIGGLISHLPGTNNMLSSLLDGQQETFCKRSTPSSKLYDISQKWNAWSISKKDLFTSSSIFDRLWVMQMVDGFSEVMRSCSRPLLLCLQFLICGLQHSNSAGVCLCNRC